MGFNEGQRGQLNRGVSGLESQKPDWIKERDVFDETIFYKINLAFSLIVVISLSLSLAIRRKYMKLILCTLIYWLGLHFYYAINTPASLTLPEIFSGFCPPFWFVGRAVIIGFYTAMIILYMLFGKKTFFRISYGVMLSLVVSEYLFYGFQMARENDFGILLPHITVSLSFLNLATPLISGFVLAFALAIRKHYTWPVLIGLSCWAGLSFYSIGFPFICVCSPGLFDFRIWAIIRTLALMFHLIMITLYIISNKRNLFWLSYGIVVFLIAEQFYSCFWGEYFGP